MAKFCTNCGKELPEGAAFCTGCGARVQEAGPAPEPAAEPAPQAAAEPAAQPVVPALVPEPEPRQEQQSQYREQPRQEEYQSPYRTEPQPQGDYPPKPEKGKKPVSTIGFMLLQLLYAIPIIGFFASLVLAIAPEKKDLKHHALASFLWKLIFIVLLIVGFVQAKKAVEVHWNEWSHSFSEAAGGAGLGDLNDIWNGLLTGDVDSILGAIDGGDLSQFQDENGVGLNELLEQYGVGSFSELIGKLESGEITEEQLERDFG